MYLGVDGSCEVCKGFLLVSLGQERGWVEQWLHCHHPWTPRQTRWPLSAELSVEHALT